MLIAGRGADWFELHHLSYGGAPTTVGFGLSEGDDPFLDQLGNGVLYEHRSLKRLRGVVVRLVLHCTLVAALDAYRVRAIPLKANEVFGTCKLCQSHAALCKSHVIPRFVMQWLRRTKGTRFWGVANPDVPLQDSLKKRLLCRACEQRFSSWEKWFSENVLHDESADSLVPLAYGPELHKFVLSVLWRITEANESLWEASWPHHWAEICATKEKWRRFLEGDKSCSPPVLHFFNATRGGIALNRRVPGFEEYMLLYSDGTLVGGGLRCYSYAKFAHFLCFAPMAGLGFKEAVFENTLVSPGGGLLGSDLWIGDLNIADMLVGRVEIMNASIARSKRASKRLR